MASGALSDFLTQTGRISRIHARHVLKPSYLVNSYISWVGNSLKAQVKKKLLFHSNRKLFTAIGNLGQTCGLIWLSFVGCNQTLAVVALGVSTAMLGSIYSGFFVRNSKQSTSKKHFEKNIVKRSTLQIL